MTELNPYASPRVHIEPGFYFIDLAKARWREVWRSTKRTKFFWTAVKAKVLGRRCIYNYQWLGPVTFDPFEIVPPAVEHGEHVSQGLGSRTQRTRHSKGPLFGRIA